MLTDSAEGVTSNNSATNSNNNDGAGVVSREAPKVIAPIKLPGVMPKGENIVENVNEELPPDEQAELEGAPTEKVEKSEKEEAAPEDKADGKSDEEGESDRLNAPADGPVKVLGKEFKSLKEAEAYLNKQAAIARGSQSAAAKETNELKQRLQALEEAIKLSNKGAKLDDTITVDPDTEQFWNDVKTGFTAIENIKEPAEKARQQAIIIGAIVQQAVNQAEERWNAQLAEKVSPFEKERVETQAEIERIERAKTVFTKVAQQVDDGNNLPVYPELTNAEDLEEIVGMWDQFRESGQVGDKILYHPDFIMTLIHSYRDLKTAKKAPKSTKEGGAKPGIKKAPSTQLPPNLTKGNGSLGFVIPGVLSRR